MSIPTHHGTTNAWFNEQELIFNLEDSSGKSLVVEPPYTTSFVWWCERTRVEPPYSIIDKNYTLSQMIEHKFVGNEVYYSEESMIKYKGNK